MVGHVCGCHRMPYTSAKKLVGRISNFLGMLVHRPTYLHCFSGSCLAFTPLPSNLQCFDENRLDGDAKIRLEVLCHRKRPFHQQAVINIRQQATPVLSYKIGITHAH